MSANAQATVSGVELNPALIVFLDDAGATIRPRVNLTGLGPQRSKIGLHNVSQAASRSATVSEIQQAIAYGNARTDISISRGLNIYCIDAEARPGPFEWFRGIVSDALRAQEEVTVRLHHFGLLSDTQAEVEDWKPGLPVWQRFSGGAYLLSNCFWESRLDRRRSYDVLARLVEVFAFTGKSRFLRPSSLSAVRESSRFRVYVAGLESYAAPAHTAAAEWLFDMALWEHLQAALPLESQAGNQPRAGTAERWLLDAASQSSTLAGMVEALRVAGAAEPCIAELALDMQVAITNAKGEHPAVGSLHAFERAVSPYDDANMLTVARSCARTMFDIFAFPIHPLFLTPPKRAVSTAALAAERARQCAALSQAIRENFYKDSRRRHREWFPLGCSPSAEAATAAAALDIRYPGTTVFETCHVDPALSTDFLDELCLGPQRVQFLHLAPVITL